MQQLDRNKLAEVLDISLKEKGLIRISIHEKLLDYFSSTSKKGLIIIGNVGTGKTVAMETFREILSKPNIRRGFRSITTRHIVREFNQEGHQTIDKYGRFSFGSKYDATKGDNPDYTKPRTVFFDDLGLEESKASMYGNTANVMAEILLDRYEMFKSHGMKTYGTSNLGIAELSEIYGERIQDRFREMCEVIVIEGKSLRK